MIHVPGWVAVMIVALTIAGCLSTEAGPPLEGLSGDSSALSLYAAHDFAYARGIGNLSVAVGGFHGVEWNASDTHGSFVVMIDPTTGIVSSIVGVTTAFYNSRIEAFGPGVAVERSEFKRMDRIEYSVRVSVDTLVRLGGEARELVLIGARAGPQDWHGWTNASVNEEVVHSVGDGPSTAWAIDPCQSAPIRFAVGRAGVLGEAARDCDYSDTSSSRRLALLLTGASRAGLVEGSFGCGATEHDLTRVVTSEASAGSSGVRPPIFEVHRCLVGPGEVIDVKLSAAGVHPTSVLTVLSVGDEHLPDLMSWK